MNSPQAVFTQGSILRHILVMTSTSALGLLSLFTVDLLDMYFLSLLGETEIVAAVGMSAALMFLVFSSCIGLQIAMGALVARAEGARQRELAGRYCTNVWIFSFSVILLMVTVMWIFLPELLQFLGAEGATLEYALSYSRIMLPSLLIVSVSMGSGAALRAVGDAKRSMFSTLAGGLTNAVLDPIFIFGLDWGVEGAAWASVCARVSVFFIATYALVKLHRLPKPTKLAFFREDLGKIIQVALPAMMTNIMTPLGGAFVLKLVAAFGPAAVAAYAVIGRIIPVAFGALFALSGAIGPIVGQNAGANLYSRVRAALFKSLNVIFLYVVVAWLVLYLAQGLIISTFGIEGIGVRVIHIYCTYLVGFFCFAGMLFIANAAFNNLQKAHWSMFFNVGRTFLGTMPMAWLLSRWFGLEGLMFGDISGAIIFGVVAYMMAARLVLKLEKETTAQ